VLRTGGFANATGGAYLQALPNVNGGQSSAEVLDPPYVDYAVHLENPGTYQLYLRFDAPAAGAPPDDLPTQSDSLFAAILGQADFYRFAKQLADPLDPPPADRTGSLDGDFATDPWQGEALLNSDAPFGNPDPAVWTLPAGNHVLRITLREDGVALDKLVLEETSLAAPTGEGPDESALGCCGDGTVDPGEQCDDGNTVAGDGCDALCQTEGGAGVCGDGTVDPGEQCDDGNTTPGDGCNALCQDEGDGFVCAPAPLEGCIPAAKASLSISEKKAGNEKLKAKLKSFEGATGQSDLGDPLTGSTRYDLCLYGPEGQLVGELSVDRATQSCGPKQKPCFKDKGGKGWLYKDPATEASGTKKITLGSGPEGKGKALWQAGNKARKNQSTMPTGIASALAGTASATLQLVISDASCFDATLTARKADGQLFKAKAP
jgi:cysteine-rich repeat protein